MATAKEDMPVSEARANITEVITHARLLRWIVFLTNRDKAVAAVVPIELGRLARRVGGADAACQVIADHLGIDVDEVRDEE